MGVRTIVYANYYLKNFSETEEIFHNYLFLFVCYIIERGLVNSKKRVLN